MIDRSGNGSKKNVVSGRNLSQDCLRRCVGGERFLGRESFAESSHSERSTSQMWLQSKGHLWFCGAWDIQN